MMLKLLAKLDHTTKFTLQIIIIIYYLFNIFFILNILLNNFSNQVNFMNEFIFYVKKDVCRNNFFEY